MMTSGFHTAPRTMHFWQISFLEVLMEGKRELISMTQEKEEWGIISGKTGYLNLLNGHPAGGIAHAHVPV